MAIFRQKKFSWASDIGRGASIGAGIGTLASHLLPNKWEYSDKERAIQREVDKQERESSRRNKAINVPAPDSSDPSAGITRFMRLKNAVNNSSQSTRTIVGAATGAVVGASLGAMAAALKGASRSLGRRWEERNLMSDTVGKLERGGFKKDVDFTQDPKMANGLGTKVCIVVTMLSGDLQILINTKNDEKLSNGTKEIIRNLPNSSVKTKRTSDKFNEITITTVSDGSAADAGFLASIAERFIRLGYPVYLVEVG